jgi:hypothetical protein
MSRILIVTLIYIGGQHKQFQFYSTLSYYTKHILPTRTSIRNSPYFEVWSYFTTDGQSVSTSSYRAPLWDLRLDITSCRNVAVWNLRNLWGALSDERMCLQFAVQSLNGPSHAEPVTIHYSLIWDFPNLEGEGECEVTLRLTVSQSVSMSWRRAHFGACDQILILS